MKSTLSLAAFVCLVSTVSAASLQKINATLDNNPTGVGFYLYVPDTLAPNPPILVNPHWCHGSAVDAYKGTQYARLADTHGFLIIYPDSPNLSDHCWDVSSPGALHHNGVGDALGIVSMVNYTLREYKGDRSRVFVTGVSSGAMMTTTLVTTYPDVFAAGSAYSGVPFGCFGAPSTVNSIEAVDYWNDDCASGRVTKTAEEWSSLVSNAFPGYTGWRPKIQIFHGTADATLNYTCFTEEVKQWVSVFGYKQTPASTTENTPLPNWTKSVYGDNDWLEAYSAQSVTHNIQQQEELTLKWFDLECRGSSCFKWGDEPTKKSK